MIIDCHVHLGRWAMPELKGLENTMKDVGRVLGRSGIDGAVIIPSDAADNAWVMGEVAKARSRKYWFFPWVHPHLPGMMDFLQSNLHRIAGLKFHPSLDKVRISDDANAPYLRFAESNRLPVMVHCGRWKEMAGYGYVLDVAQRLPGLDLVCGHQGGDPPQFKWESADEVARRKLDNVFFDIVGTREFWTITHGIGVLGPERYLFGSDLPLAHPAMYLAVVNEALGLRKADRERLLSGNLLRLLPKR
jgi:predicted TIM-barrel fold metal-dependent hydrolase